MRLPTAALVCVFAAGTVASGQTSGAIGPAPLRLRDAVAEALRFSPALSGAEDAVESARIQNRLAESRFGLKVVPTINTGTAPGGLGQRTIGVDVTKRLPFGSEISTSVNSLTYGTGPAALHDAGYTIGVTQPLVRGMASTTFDLKNAQRATIASSRGMAEARQQLIVTVADRFFSVIKAQRLLLASDRALDRATTLSKASEARTKVGLATQLDVLRADLLASQASVTVAAQREALAAATEELNLLLGRPPSQPLEIADEELTDDSLVAQGFRLPNGSDPQAADRYVRKALEARLDVREAHDKVGDAQRTVSLSKWDLLPQLNLNASYTERGLGPSATPGFADFLNGWRVGLTTNYALDRSDQIAAIGSASVSLRAAQRTALATDRRVEADVRRAFRAWARSAATIEIQRKSVDLSGKQLRLAELRYERGLASSLDLIDAENNLYQAQSAFIGAEVERALAALTLDRVSGSLDPARFQP